MSIQAITAVAPTAPSGYIAQASPDVSPGQAANFATQMTGAVDNLQGLQSVSNTLAIKAVTGSLDDISKATVAASRATITMELTAALRDKGVAAFNEIMRMQG
jgi:flagellar hook-basal body complex protein FliE